MVSMRINILLNCAPALLSLVREIKKKFITIKKNDFCVFLNPFTTLACVVLIVVSDMVWGLI